MTIPRDKDNAEPSDLIGYLRPEVITFAVAMETRLKMNDHKGGWQETSEGDSVDRIQDTLQELELAVVRNEPAIAILSQAADCANWAMFIADNHQRLANTLTLQELASAIVHQK